MVNPPFVTKAIKSEFYPLKLPYTNFLKQGKRKKKKKKGGKENTVSLNEILKILNLCRN